MSTTISAAERDQEVIKNLTEVRQTVDQLKGSNTVKLQFLA
jgi:hypothetical protein